MTALAYAGRLERLRSSPWAIPLALTAAAGVALRVYVDRSVIGTPDSDEAIPALMIRHVLHGDLTVFYWGQAYGGTQEIFLSVPVFWLFGSSWLALRVVPIALAALASVVLWRVGLRVFGETQGKAAGALAWVWPPFAVFYLTHQYGFYASDVLYCSLILLLALRAVERPDVLRVGTLGLVLGLALWETEQIVPIALPVVAWTVWRRPRVLRFAPVAVAASAMGALPWLVWNARHGWVSLNALPGGSTYWHRERIFFSPLVPMITGLRVPYSQAPLAGPGAVTTLVLLVVIGLVLWGAIRAFRLGRRSSASLLYLVALVYGPIYAISPPTFESRQPRYLIVLVPVLVLLLAQLATTYRRALVVIAAAALLSFAVLHEMNGFRTSNPQAFEPAPRNIAPLIATLDRLHVRRAYGDYWAVYPIDFDTRERIIAVENDMHAVSFAGERVRLAPSFARWQAYVQAVARDPSPGFVFFAAELPQETIVPLLERHGYRRYPVGPFVVVARPPQGARQSP